MVQYIIPLFALFVSFSCLNRHLSKHTGHAHAMDVCGFHTWPKKVHKNDSLILIYDFPLFRKEADRTKQKRQCKNVKGFKNTLFFISSKPLVGFSVIV